MFRLWWAAPAVVILAWTSGCAGRGPNWGYQGTALQQQQRAQRFDPYPENNIGPTLTGVRPREYEKPYPEPLRAQWERWNPGYYQAGAR